MLAGAAASAFGKRAMADAWPAEPIAWIVPLAAGGINDAFARPVAAHVSKALGKPVIVDNRSGAGGTVGAALVARAPADGYTMLIGNPAHTYAPLIYPSSGFDLMRDFAPISALARVPQALIVNSAVLDVSSLQQFIDAARARPNTIDVGSSGIGTVNHLGIELLESRAGIQLNHVPYRGSAPAIQDLLSGNVAAIFNPVANLMSYLRNGKLRVLAIAGRRREPVLPEVPTFQEAGLADFRVVLWVGLFAPVQTPASILDRMHSVVQAALASDEVKQAWAEQGARVEPESRAEFGRFVEQEGERWRRITRAVEIVMD
ncbi:MAG: tripartite tricarboxylate transporter substrate binding protein [Reyranellaceae bacterium]